MSKKTFIKLRRGLILDPEHRQELGNSIWLFLYMLDLADWETGIIYEWRDKDAADELQMPLPTVRVQRYKIMEGDYISCSQHGNCQTITIKKWKDPRDKSNNKLLPADCDEDENDSEGNNKSNNKGNQNLLGLHIINISDTILKNKIKEPKMNNNEISHKVSTIEDYHDRILEAYKLKTGDDTAHSSSAFASMAVMFQDAGVTVQDYLDSIDEQDRDKRYSGGSPTAYQKWTLNKISKRNKKSKQINQSPDNYRKGWTK